jgi:hypothetical protein
VRRPPAALLTAATALLLYLALGQRAFHGNDAYHYLHALDAGNLRNAQIPLYPPLGWLWSRALAICGVPLYEALRSLSAVAAALGVLAAHRAALTLLGDRRRALLVAAGCALTPAVLDTATVVEVDAVLFACACAAWLPFARLLRGGGFGGGFGAAGATGLVTAVAAGFHGAGHLLAAVLCGLQLAWGWPQRSLRATLPRMLVLAAVHAAASLVLGWLDGGGGQAAMASNTAGLGFRAAFVPHVLWHEWLLPYVPFGVLPLAALRARGLRAAALGALACLCGYLLVTTLVLGLLEPTGPALPHDGVYEYGSFLLGWTLPAVLLSIAALPLRAGAVAVAVAGVAGVWQVRAHDWPPDPDGYAAGYAEVAAAGPVHVIVDDAREWAWIARRHPGADVTMVRGYLELQVLPTAERQHMPLRPELFVVPFLLWRPAGDAPPALLVTERALARMRDSPVELLATAARELLPQKFAFEPVNARGFRAFRLRQK